MNAEFRESLYDLYELGGLEMVKQGCRGMKRQLWLDLEMSGLDPEHHDIIRFRAVNVWDEDDEFTEYARPREPLTDLAEQITGITNARLADCRPSSEVMLEFLAFIDGAELFAKGMEFDQWLLKTWLRSGLQES